MNSLDYHQDEHGDLVMNKIPAKTVFSTSLFSLANPERLETRITLRAKNGIAVHQVVGQVPRGNVPCARLLEWEPKLWI